MAQETLLTVIIPTRHRDDLLALCLSRLAPGVQSLPADKYEVFVTDDGSETTSEKMVAEKFPWVTWLSGPRRGPAANRNYAAKYGSAPWLVFTDDDCVPSTEWLKAYADAIVADEAAGQSKDVYEGKTTCEAGVTSPLQHAPINETGGWLWSCNMAFRRPIFAKLGGFDEEFPFAHMEDVDLRERVLGMGAVTKFVPNAVVDHPPRPDNLFGKVAPTHESEYLMYYKTGGKGDFLLRHLRLLANARFRKYFAHRSHADAGVLIRSFFIEAAYVIKHGGAWQKKYRERYKGVKPLYMPDIADRLHYR